MDQVREFLAELNAIDFFLCFIPPLSLFLLVPFLILFVSLILGIKKNIQGRLDIKLPGLIETLIIFYFPINILITSFLDNKIWTWFSVLVIIFYFLSSYYFSLHYEQYKSTNWRFILLYLIAYNLRLFIVDFFFLYQGHYKYVYATQVGYQTIAYGGISLSLVIYFVLVIFTFVKSKFSSK
mgnify:CR=1 FL=1